MESTSKNIIYQVVENFGFSSEETQKVVEDLSDAIALKLAVNLGSRDVFTEESKKLQAALDKKDRDAIEKIIKDLGSGKEFMSTLNDVVQGVLGDWMISMGKDFSDQKREEMAESLSLIVER